MGDERLLNAERSRQARRDFDAVEQLMFHGISGNDAEYPGTEIVSGTQEESDLSSG